MVDLAAQQEKFLQQRTTQRDLQKQRHNLVQSLQLVSEELQAKLASTGASDLSPSDPLKVRQAQLAAQLPGVESAAAGADAGVQTLLQELYAQQSAEELVTQLPGNIPFLLLPVRLETRFCRIRHVSKPANRQFLIDCSSMFPNLQQQQRLRDWGKHRNAKGVALQIRGVFPIVPGLSVGQVFQRVRSAVQQGQLAPANGKWLQGKDDDFELRIRIVPDDVHIDSFEEGLTPDELQRGRAFWERVWTSNNSETERANAWAELRHFFSTPRSAWIVRQTQPRNFNEGTNLAGAPQFDDPPLRANSYTQAPVATLLPDFFTAVLSRSDKPDRVVKGNLITREIYTGFDPNEPDPTSFQPDELGNLKFPDALRWIFDFDEAEKRGMAIRVPLSKDEFERGFDKLVVLGVKLSAGKLESTQLLKTLFEHHTYQEKGMYLVPQGTPTNNFGAAKSGYNWPDREAAQHLKAAFGAGHVWTDDQRSKPFLTPDGLRLTQALGIDEESSRRLPGADCEDVREALAMNRLLFPGTLGYYLRQFFLPPLNEGGLTDVQSFFEQFVSGRGLLPAVRIGSQPYGILPVTTFSFWRSTDPKTFTQRLLDDTLKKLDVFWDDATSKVRFAGDGKVQGLQYSQELIELAATDPTSSRYSQRALFGEGYLNTVFRLNLRFFLGLPLGGQLSAPPDVNEFPGKIEPELRAKFFDPALFSSFRFMHLYPNKRMLAGPLIDSPPASETEPLSPFPGLSSNYLDWLLDSSIDDLWKERLPNVSGSPAPAPPRALLYQFARFALRRGALERALRLAEPNEKLRLLKTRDLELLAIMKESTDINPAALNQVTILGHYFQPLLRALDIQNTFSLKRDRFGVFDQTFGTPPKTLRDVLKSGNVPEAQAFREQRNALTVLRGLPTARLERLFCEHIDLCSYRLDAWFNAIVLSRLAQQRSTQTGAQGIYLGAFGILENVKPQASAQFVKEVEAVFTDQFDPQTTIFPVVHMKGLETLASDVDKLLENSFVYLGGSPSPDCVLDAGAGKVVMRPREVDGNKGFIHGPSQEHAATAGILRAGWESRKADGGDTGSALAVRVDSARVRAALSLLEGIGQGDTLASLFGYQLERMLHDISADAVIFRVRQKFPLKTDSAANSFAATTDGMALLKAWPNVALSDADKARLAPLVQNLSAQFDALSDLMLTESVFQTVKDSPARAAAALRTVNASGQLHQPEVVRTPQTGSLVTFRTGVVFPKTDFLSAWEATLTPRAIASPQLNNWLAGQLPDPARVIVIPDQLTLKDLDLQPLDLLANFPDQNMVVTQNHQLAWLAQTVFRAKNGLPVDAPVEIDFTKHSSDDADEITIFELAPLVHQLRTLVAASHLLSANHFLREGSLGVTPVFDVSEIEAALARIVKDEQQPQRLSDRVVSAVSELQNATGDARQPAWSKLLGTLAEVTRWQNDNPALEIAAQFNESQLQLLLIKATFVAKIFAQMQADAEALLDQLQNAQPSDKFAVAEQLAERLFGKAFRICPRFNLENVPVVKQARTTDLSRNLNPLTLENWQCHSALVHPVFRTYRQCAMLREALAAPAAGDVLHVLQFNPPTAPPGFWVGAEMRGTNAAEDVSQKYAGTLSLALEVPNDWNLQQSFAGLMFDEWTDVLPARTATTGVAFHFNQPDTEPPQVMLLAVCPSESGNWRWEYLTLTIFETIERAKKRLVTFEQLKQNPALDHLLPAVVAPLDRGNLHPNLDLGRNHVDPALDENGGAPLISL